MRTISLGLLKLELATRKTTLPICSVQTAVISDSYIDETSWFLAVCCRPIDDDIMMSHGSLILRRGGIYRLLKLCQQ